MVYTYIIELYQIIGQVYKYAVKFKALMKHYVICLTNFNKYYLVWILANT